MAAILNIIQNNYRDFPREVATKAGQAFVATVVIHLLVGAGSSMALLGGAIAVTATLIEAVTRPIIKAIFSESPLASLFVQILISEMMALGLAASVAPWIGMAYDVDAAYRRISAPLSLITFVVLNRGFNERNAALAFVI